MNKVLIIAEAGVNHNGDIENAKKLIDIAAYAGADYVKFQAFKAENIVSKNSKKADYQMKNIGDNDDSQFNMLKNLEFKDSWYDILVDYCNNKGVNFLTTPFDYQSVDQVDPYVDMYKIPSGEITNLPYIERIASKNKPVIISTGMANMSEIKDVLSVFKNLNFKMEDITVLHCNTEYPTPFVDVHLNAMNTIKKEFDIKVGYSDHTVGIEVPIAAVALGAQVIEKHFTIDKNLPGPDHKASLEKEELKKMVNSIRNIEAALGVSEKKPSPSEQKNISVMRKSIVAKKQIKKGDLLTSENISVKRPGSGISPMKWYEVLNKKATKDFQPDDLITL